MPQSVYTVPSMNYRLILVLGTMLAVLTHASSQQPEQLTKEKAEAMVAALKYQDGEITLADHLASLKLPETLHYLNPADTDTVLVKLWGNMPDKTLGMILPSNLSPIDPKCWGVILTYSEDGHIKDSDADTINYSELLSNMQASEKEINAERAKNGLEEIHVVGWARPPIYDKSTKKFYWAKELKFGNQAEHTLNYNIRVLGRSGVLVLNIVASMSQLPDIETNVPTIVSTVDFLPGHRYADFNPNTDKMAAYGLAALVAGGIIGAKVGLFKALWIAIVAGWKYILIGFAFIASKFRKIFAKKDKSQLPPAAGL